jgi:hypothetical protein
VASGSLIAFYVVELDDPSIDTTVALMMCDMQELSGNWTTARVASDG